MLPFVHQLIRTGFSRAFFFPHLLPPAAAATAPATEKRAAATAATLHRRLIRPGRVGELRHSDTQRLRVEGEKVKEEACTPGQKDGINIRPSFLHGHKVGVQASGALTDVKGPVL